MRRSARRGPSDIGASLLIAGACAVVSMQVAGRVSDRITPRTPTLVGAFVVDVGIAAASMATSRVSLFAAATLVGAGNGAMGVSMNALGIDAERATDRHFMSRFHACASLGGFIGSMLVLVLAAAHLGARGTMLLVAGAAPLAILVLMRRMPRAGHVADHSAPHLPGINEPLPAGTLLLGIMALFFGLTEGTAVDWSAIHVTDVTGVSPSVGAAGLGCVTASMVAVRLVGDRLVHRLGRVRAVRLGAPVSVCGFGVVAVAHALPIVLAGWAVVGLGWACSHPRSTASPGIEEA